MLDKFHDIIGGIHVPVDDGVDKLNRKYTLLVFLFLALPIFTKQYIGDPIECFAPVYFAEHQSRYINSYCWTQSTYYMVPVGDPDDDGDQQEPPDRIMPDEVDYFIGFETVTHIGNERLRRVRVSYYQWAPLILLAQGLCFYIPFLIWNSCANNAGVKLRRLLKKASDIASLPPGCQQREALLAEFVDQFHTLVTGEAGWCADLQCGGGGGAVGGGGGGGSSANSSASGSSAASGPAQLANGQTRGGGGGGGGRGAGPNQQAADSDHQSSHHRRRNNNNNNNQDDPASTGCCLVSIPIIGSLISCCLKPFSWFSVGPSKYLCCLYLLVKTGYVFNVGLQFFLLGQFLGRGYLRHGLELINRLLTSGEWWASPRFPLSTLCQVRADMSGGLRSYTCQCVLPINVFNEKIFSVVWFYMAFLLPLNVLSLLFWIYRSFETNRMSYIRLCLWRTRLVELNQIHRTVRRLSQSYLGWDGVFLLRLIEHNHGSIMATLIMSRLWEFYANQIKLQEDANQMALASNAQHTLSQTTTAISNQYHQFLTNQPHGASHQHQHAAPPAPQQIAGGGGGGGHHHGHGHHHPPPAVPGNVNHGGGGPHSHHNHSLHGPAGHFAHGPHPPLQPTQASGFPGGGGGPQHPPPPMVAHGQHGHHSGQISQGPPGHHPLHAANTAAAAAVAAAAHHVHHGALASNSGPHLSGAFTGPSASLLAHLQQQAAHANAASGGPGGPNQTGGQGQQQPGNVKAVAAALAAAAAATTNSQPSSASQIHQQQQQAHANTGGSNAQQQQQTAGPIHLQAMKQQTGQAQQQQQQQQQHAAQQAQQQQAGANAAGQTGQQQASSSATTSFITSATAGSAAAAAAASAAALPGGPPLPPPPPAHVVAAVAAASGTGGIASGVNSAAISAAAGRGPAGAQVASSRSTGGGAPVATAAGGQPAPPPHNNLFNLKASNLQAANASGTNGGSNQQQATQQQAGQQQQQSRFATKRS